MKINQEVAKEMDATGLPWRAEAGGKHIKLILDGKLVGIMPLAGGGGHRAKLNIISQIRRAARGLKS